MVRDAADVDWDLRTGFDTKFVGFATSTPEVQPSIADDLLEIEGGRTQLDYVHFSLTMSREAGWRDGSPGTSMAPHCGRLPVQASGRTVGSPDERQVLGGVYLHNKLDQGHIARRADVVWGLPEEAENANYDSSYFTNITPQMEGFNQSVKDGVWGRLENALLDRSTSPIVG
jgi:endonuclease G, mitochondrial